jgi:alkanesulfonate monooxygenase SsuD/methylene tetrahydromethanopterin reductase-like flavin-dependent oxidoreductase (luciferase family)
MIFFAFQSNFAESTFTLKLLWPVWGVETTMGRLQFGLYVATARKGPFEVAEQALAAEKCGFDSFWFSDHLIDDNIDLLHGETWTSLTLAATRTRKIKLASGVTDPFRRHPSVTAQTVATLDHISSGRAVLGLGAGEAMNLVPFGIKFEAPVMRLRESIDVIRRLWRASNREPTSLNGNLFTLRDAFIQILPVQKPLPPIYVGALSKKTRELTGEIGDGWLPWINSPASYKERLRDVERGARSAGRSLEELDLVATLDVAISRDRDMARQAALSPGKAALVLERGLLEEMGYHISLPENVSIRTGIFSRDTVRLVEQAMSLVPDEAVDQISAFGTADDCKAKIEQFVREGARHILVVNQGPDQEVTLRTISQEIMPYLREIYSDM